MTRVDFDARPTVYAFLLSSFAALAQCGIVEAQPVGIQPLTDQQSTAAQEMKAAAAKVRARQRGEDFPDSTDPVVVRVIADWKTRAAAIKTARIAWTQRRFDKAGSLGDFRFMDVPKGAVAPAIDTVLSDSRVLLYKHGRVRLDTAGQFWLAGRANLADGSKAEGFDRGRIRALSVLKHGATAEKGGMVCDHDELTYLKALDAMPVAITLAPFNAELCKFSERGLVRAPELDDADSSCIKVGRMSSWLWISKSHPAQLVRYETRRKDSSIASQLKASWRRLPDGMWIPDAWSLTSFDENQQIERFKEFVVESFIVNEPIGDAELDVVFSEGTEVYDQTTGVLGVADADGVVVPHARRGVNNFGRGTRWLALSVMILSCIALIMRWRIIPARKAPHAIT